MTKRPELRAVIHSCLWITCALLFLVGFVTVLAVKGNHAIESATAVNDSDDIVLVARDGQEDGGGHDGPFGWLVGIA